MSVSDEIRRQLIDTFRAEMGEHVQVIMDGLLALELSDAPEVQNASTKEQIFRAAHSLKGAARAVGIKAVERMAHALEDVLADIHQQKIPLRPDLFTVSYGVLDAIRAVRVTIDSADQQLSPQALKALAALDAVRAQSHKGAVEKIDAEVSETAYDVSLPCSSGVAPVADVPPVEPVPQAGDFDTIRVSVEKLDALMAQLSELLVARLRIEQRLEQLQNLQELFSEWPLAEQGGHVDYRDLLAPQLDTPSTTGEDDDVARIRAYMALDQDRVRRVRQHLATLVRETDNDVRQMTLALEAVEREVKRARMLPLNTIATTLKRMVRDLAQQSGKEVNLDIVGGEIELDKMILEKIKDPLVHLLRNAVDHGIEAPDVRLSRDKPSSGTITLSARQVGKEVLIQIRDDGAGLDIEAIRQLAEKYGLANTSKSISDSEVAQFIFRAGVSTKAEVTDLSGRGIGLSVVRSNIEALQGRITVAWEPGQGTVFSLFVPLTVGIVRGLLVRVSDELFAIPFSAIERLMLIEAGEVLAFEGYDAVLYKGQPVPLVPLWDILQIPHAPLHREERWTAVLLNVSNRQIAILVDKLLGEREMVIKGLGKQLVRVRGFSGATVRENGDVVLVLSAADLAEMAMRVRHPAHLQDAQPLFTSSPAIHRVLVVDDSITTRTLEKNILEAAGYHVKVATDGQAALDVIKSGWIPDVVITDVDMPRLNGLALTRKIKNNPKLSHIPVLLVTSLDSVENRILGIEIEADAYIPKANFDQDEFLSTVAQLT